MDRLALHEKYRDISAKRDDCTLDHSILLTELGRYDEAKALLDNHWFHTYEGRRGQPDPPSCMADDADWNEAA